MGHATRYQILEDRNLVRWQMDKANNYLRTAERVCVLLPALLRELSWPLDQVIVGVDKPRD
jgi:hypothetical protein